MNDDVKHQREVLQAFPFLAGDEKWGGQIEIVRRVTTVEGNRPRTYIDLVMRVGTRFLVLPWRGLAEIEAALHEACPVAESHRAELLEQLARDKDQRIGSGSNGSGVGYGGPPRHSNGGGRSNQPGRKRYDEE